MSCVLDAYAVVAALVGEPARAAVEPLISTGAIAAPNLAEVLDVCVRVHGNGEELVRERFRWLIVGGLEVVDLNETLALRAGSVRALRYRKRTCEISLGDCFAMAVAHARRAPLATSDPALVRAAGAEGIEIIALPDSRGRRPRIE